MTVPITAAMSTSGRLVVYYIRPDGEVVADGIDFKVEECTANDVSLIYLCGLRCKSNLPVWFMTLILSDITL